MKPLTDEEYAERIAMLRARREEREYSKLLHGGKPPRHQEPLKDITNQLSIGLGFLAAVFLSALMGYYAGTLIFGDSSSVRNAPVLPGVW